MEVLPDLRPSRDAILSSLFHRDYRWLRDRMRARLGCRTQAEEVASEAFAQLAAMSGLEDIREPRAMLSTIARRITFDLWRRRDLERHHLETLSFSPQSMHPSPEERALAVESICAIDLALSALPPKTRQAFLYSQLDDLKYTEIAERLGVSVSSVRQYVSKALTVCHEATDG